MRNCDRTRRTGNECTIIVVVLERLFVVIWFDASDIVRRRREEGLHQLLQGVSELNGYNHH